MTTEVNNSLSPAKVIHIHNVNFAKVPEIMIPQQKLGPLLHRLSKGKSW